MPSYTVDLSKYRERLSATVPDDRYLAQIDDYEFSKSKAGNDMFTVWVRIVSGPYAGNVIIERLSLSEKALFKIVGFLNGLGIATPKKRLSVNPEAWLNKKVYIDTAKGEPYRGNPGTSQIQGYSRYMQATETEDAVSEASDYIETVPADVRAGEPQGAVDYASPETAEDGPVEVPVPSEPEMLNLSDISL